MSIFQDIPQGLREMSPTFIIAPSTRNGTTLVQRLINSSREMLIFGEDSMIMKGIPYILDAVRGRVEDREDRVLEIQEQFKSETRDFWSNNLLPQGAGIWKASLNWALETFSYCQEQAEGLGAKRWGCKYPLDHYRVAEEYFSVLPAAKFIFIYRDFYDVARSAKARTWLKSERDLEAMAFRWKQNMLWALNLKRDNFYLLKYENLIENSEEEIRKLQEFLALEGIDKAIMEKKINTFQGSPEEGCSPTGYIEPCDLSDKEMAIIAKTAGRALRQAGYSSPSLSA
ncbi:hypothetical protein SCG7109_AH_00220 [Chlamydiales bacterium SCGC AG-110-M15]|nr:hypothetical protein SCG7109_AH_00220 [Chlamydiales bacterium SCGC AG-110-M15]